MPSSACACVTAAFAGAAKNARSSSLRPSSAGISVAVAKNAFNRGSDDQAARVNSIGSGNSRASERRCAIVRSAPGAILLW